MEVETQWTKPLLKIGGGRTDKTHHACIWAMRSSRSAYAATFRGDGGGGGGVNMVRNAFVADQCTEFIFAFTPLLLLCFFGFI